MIPVPDQVLSHLALSYGTTRQSLAFLGGGYPESDGIAYSYDVDGSLRVLKVLALEDEPEKLYKIKERAKFIYFLGERGLNIAYPLPSPKGNLCESFTLESQTFIAYAMERVKGNHPPQESWNQEFYRNWGRLVGKMHRLAKLYPSWQYSEVEELPGRRLLAWQDEYRLLDGLCKDPEVKECWASLYERMNRLPITREGFGFIHNDPHTRNLLVEGDRIVLLDFDVAGYNWFINDIAIAMQSLFFEVTGGIESPLRDAKPLHDFLTDFLTGYETENHLDSCWLEQIDLFISYRRALLYIVMQDVPPPSQEAKEMFKEMVLKEPPLINQK